MMQPVGAARLFLDTTSVLVLQDVTFKLEPEACRRMFPCDIDSLFANTAERLVGQPSRTEPL